MLDWRTEASQIVTALLRSRKCHCAVLAADQAATSAQAYKTYKLGGKLSEMLYSPAAYGVDFSGRDLPRPKARANAHLAVVGNTLWLMGGLVEVRLPGHAHRCQGLACHPCQSTSTFHAWFLAHEAEQWLVTHRQR